MFVLVSCLRAKIHAEDSLPSKLIDMKISISSPLSIRACAVLGPSREALLVIGGGSDLPPVRN